MVYTLSIALLDLRSDQKIYGC